MIQRWFRKLSAVSPQGYSFGHPIPDESYWVLAEVAHGSTRRYQGPVD